MVCILTIRPVDLQVVIPRVTEVAKTQHTTNQQDTLQQQQFAGQWQQIAANRQQQVQGTKKDETKVGRERHTQEHSSEKEGQKHHEDKHSDADMENHPSNQDPVRGNLVDIKT